MKSSKTEIAPLLGIDNLPMPNIMMTALGPEPIKPCALCRYEITWHCPIEKDTMICLRKSIDPKVVHE